MNRTVKEDLVIFLFWIMSGIAAYGGAELALANEGTMNLFEWTGSIMFLVGTFLFVLLGTVGYAKFCE